jgi:hypothetical protein
MKTFRILFILLLFVLVGFVFHSFYSIPEPENNEQQLVAKANLLSLQYPQEKVYLHLDRPSYWANDDIWFKAYVKNSPINECNLYVEIINSAGFVVYKNISWVQNGLAYGDFHIDENLPSGIYQIRAYTNWMRNFDEEWFFRKDLVIWNLSDKDKLPESKAIKQRDIDLQFFPEGGTFVQGLKNKVAFKAVNDFGKGVDFTGEILDDSGNKILDFESLYNGMGSFVLEPHEGKKYTAKVEFQGDIVKNIKLPEAQNKGLTLAIESTKLDKIDIQVSSNLSTRDSLKFLIVGQAEGVICFRKKISTAEKTSRFEIEKKNLPGGILKFTVFNADILPVCERLVFNNYVNVVNLNIVTDKSTYVPRDSVKVSVEAISVDGMPNFANLSMSVYNPDNQLKNDKYANNIFTYFLINSELKGNIENPQYYFKDDSLATQTALDNLMLTHGYRYFEWKEILSDETPEVLYEPESSVELKGKVVSILTEKPLENCKITMMTVKSLLGVYETFTDSLGLFSFPDLFFYDTIQVSIQALNRKGNRNTIIQLDRSSIVSPEVNFLPFLYEYKEEEPVETLTYLSESEGDLIKRKWSLSDTILLEEIYITAKKRKEDDGHFRIYNDADFVLDMNDEQKLDVGNVYDAIEGRFPGVRHEEAEESFVYRGRSLMIYLDGMPADYDLLRTFPAEAFDKIELVRMGIFAGVNTERGILFFYTKRGEKFINMPTDKLGMKSAKIVGYAPIRMFYSPKYETTKQPTILDDYRNTLYWNPIVRTDSTGVATILYNNSDEMGNMKIIVEGVTADGKLCRGEANYEVSY